MGPVPLDFVQEWDQLEPDFAAAIEIIPEKVFDHTRSLVRPKKTFDDSLFTKRELRIMSGLAERFRDDFSQPMVNVTHLEQGPWDKIWDNGRGATTRASRTHLPCQTMIRTARKRYWSPPANTKEIAAAHRY